MAALPVPPVPVPEPAALSEGARLIDTFIAPSKTFTDLRRNSSWWVPWLIISVFAVAFILLVGQQIGFEQAAHNQAVQSSRFDRLDPVQQAQQLRMMASGIKYTGYALPIVMLVSFLVIALVLMATFNFGAGAEVRFGTSLAIVSYGSLPGVIHLALSMIVLFAGVDREGYNLNTPFASNPAYFMDPSAHKFLYGMASALDVFMLWNIVLMGIGFACNSKVKRSSAIGIVLGWYILYKLLGSGLGALFS